MSVILVTVKFPCARVNKGDFNFGHKYQYQLMISQQSQQNWLNNVYHSVSMCMFKCRKAKRG